MSRETHLVCKCGHLDDQHQTLKPDVKLLAQFSRPCYGKLSTKPCPCERWEAVIETQYVVPFRGSKTLLAKLEGIVERRKQKGPGYRWLV